VRFRPNAFVQVDSTGAVTLWASRSEMGQGVQTALALVLAEELAADWERVRVVQAFAHPQFGGVNTGGSDSVRRTWEPLRRAGAAAREMLVAAAALAWHVPPAECAAIAGAVLHHASGRRLDYGELAASAARLPVPTAPRLKDAASFRLLGREGIRRVDTPAKVDGSARFGLDVAVPGMLHAVVARCPTFGGRLRAFDAAAAAAAPGVRRVVEIGSGVAVVATSTWSALRARERLRVDWDEGAGAAEHSSAHEEALRRAVAQGGGLVVLAEGDVEEALAAAAHPVDAVYETPFLAHATLEPMNATAHVQAGRCEVWAPTQYPTWAQTEARRITGLPADAVRVNVTFLGGGFGRRVNPDFVIEAVEVSKAVGAPVKVTWTRQDDMRHDFYRPATCHRLTAALGPDGGLLAWRHRVASASIRLYSEPAHQHGEEQEVEGARDLPYPVGHRRLEYSHVPSVVPRGWWRSIGYAHNTFAIESFLDELAHAAGEDPYLFRRRLLAQAAAAPRRPAADGEVDAARLLAVLERAAALARWGRRRPGRHLGIACQASFRSYVAQVAEVSAGKGGALRVHRVCCAVDCGQVVHRDGVRAQMEGGIAFGLGAALHGRITVRGGRVEQGSYADYRVLRLSEMPDVEVAIVGGDAPPGGCGEPAVPVIAPAVLNAWFAATGRRVRRLPFTLHEEVS
jgi:isoquinoline 1-oxidoreductase beta subunit